MTERTRRVANDSLLREGTAKAATENVFFTLTSLRLLKCS